MPVEIVTVPCRSDNYAYLIRDAGGQVALVDAPEVAPIVAAASRCERSMLCTSSLTCCMRR